MLKNDYGYPIRQAFIKGNDPLAVKVKALRDKMHAEGRAFIGEEELAKKNGWQVFESKWGWK